MYVVIPSFEVDLKFQRIRGSERPDVEIPSCEVDLRVQNGSGYMWVGTAHNIYLWCIMEFALESSTLGGRHYSLRRISQETVSCQGSPVPLTTSFA